MQAEVPTPAPHVEVSSLLLAGEENQSLWVSRFLDEEGLGSEHPVLYEAKISSPGQPVVCGAAAGYGRGCRTNTVQRQRCPTSVRLALKPGVYGIPGWEGNPHFT